MATRDTKPDPNNGNQLTPTWALFRKSSSRVEKRQEFLPTIDQTIPPDLDADLAWLEHYTEATPTFDAALERLDPGESIVLSTTDPKTGTITKTWSVVPLDQSTIDDRAPGVTANDVGRAYEV